MLTAFLLAASVATPIGGRLGDSFGKRRMLVVSLGALSVGAVVAALATSIEVMIAARVIQGLGGGALPLAFGIIRDELPPRRIPGAIAFTSTLLAIGFGAGIVLAGPIIDTLGYHWLFLLPAAVSGVGAIVALLVIPESAVRSGEPIATIPAVLLTGWLVTLLVGVSKAPQWGWASPAVGGCLAAAAALFALWVYAERTVEVPLIDLHLMGSRGVWSANLVALLIGVAMYGSFGFLPQFNQTPRENGYGFGASVAEAGHMMLPAAAGTFLCGLVAAPLASRIGVRQAIVLGCLITSGGLGLAVLAHDQKWEMYLAGGLSGLGTGLTFACLANAVVAAVPPEKTGVATGMNANIRTVGGSIGAAMMTTIVTANLQPSGFPAEGGYTVGFAFLASAALFAGFAGLLIPRAPRFTGERTAAQFATVAGEPTWELDASRPKSAERGAIR